MVEEMLQLLEDIVVGKNEVMQKTRTRGVLWLRLWKL